MRVQVIQHGIGRTLERDGVTYTPIRAPHALDDFEINIIDLSEATMWQYKGDTMGKIDAYQDLDTLQQMVSNKKSATVVYVLPQNSMYSWSTRFSHPDRKPIKDVLDGVFKNSIEKAIPLNTAMVKIAYEKTGTTIQGSVYEADFYLLNPKDIVTKSDKSEKPTTIKIDAGVYATTLAITKDAGKLKHYVFALFEKRERSVAPEWIENIVFGDDEEQRDTIRRCEAEIEAAKIAIRAAEDKLNKNEEYKSVLYTNGDELVAVVVKMLEELLGCDLSSFVDEKKEDFLVKLPGHTFIGEIKGVTSNVKYEHISQVELHYRGYLDRLTESGDVEKVKQLLIMNPFRTKPLEQRAPIHEDQIKLAERNECLIIETNTLLRVYERFCKGQLSVQACIAVLAAKTGLLSISDFDDMTEDLAPYKI